MLAYGKRKNFAVKGNRGVTVTRIQDTYEVFEGKHEPIVDEDLWQKCHEKRLKTKGKPQKKDKDHEYILSTLLRCPKCGSPMYGAHNSSKKKTDGTLYSTYYYYKCKHQFGATGHSCEFKSQVGAKKLDQNVRDIIMSLVSSEEFSEALKRKMVYKENTDDIENEIRNLEKQKHQVEGTVRKRLDEQEHLDIDDKHYDRKYENISRSLDSLYDKLDEIEDAILVKKKCIRGIRANQINREKVYELLGHFSEVYDRMSDAEKKEYMSLIIDRIEIFEDKQSNGRRVKQIDFKFPIYVGDKEVTSMIFPTLDNKCGDGRVDVKGKIVNIEKRLKIVGLWLHF